MSIFSRKTKLKPKSGFLQTRSVTGKAVVLNLKQASAVIPINDTITRIIFANYVDDIEVSYEDIIAILAKL